jgi:hypothetical protein
MIIKQTQSDVQINAKEIKICTDGKHHKFYRVNSDIIRDSVVPCDNSCSNWGTLKAANKAVQLTMEQGDFNNQIVQSVKPFHLVQIVFPDGGKMVKKHTDPIFQKELQFVSQRIGLDPVNQDHVWGWKDDDGTPLALFVDGVNSKLQLKKREGEVYTMVYEYSMTNLEIGIWSELHPA